MKKLIIHPKTAGETFGDFAYKNLRNNIMLMNLEPGESIDEHAMAQLLDISRTPVHEAILRLRDEHLVDVIPRKNITITKINLSYVSEGVFWRCTVEPSIIKSLVNNVPANYAQLLWENLLFQEKLINEHGNRADFFSADDEFHKLLYLAANKGLIYSKKRYITSHFDRVRYIIRLLGDKDLESPSYQQHLNIYQLILYGGVVDDVFMNGFIDHITAFNKTLPYIIKDNPHFFDFGSSNELTSLLLEQDKVL